MKENEQIILAVILILLNGLCAYKNFKFKNYFISYLNIVAIFIIILCTLLNI